MWLTGCQSKQLGKPNILSTSQAPAATSFASHDDTLPVAGNGSMHVGLTHHQPDGNRVLNMSGTLPAVDPLDIPLAGRPTWVATVSTESGSMWAVTLVDGTVQAFSVTNDRAEELVISPDRLPPDMPPMLYLSDGEPRLLVPGADFSALTHPVFINAEGDFAYVKPDGVMAIQSADGTTLLDVDALVDARILVDDAGRLLFLSGPTERYAHGVLGDRIEASTITLVETNPVPQVVQRIVVPEPDVIEGIAPIWADLDGDGQREIIVTLSNANEGARVVIYKEDGELLVRGPAIGRGSRWRHQLAVAPFGPGGQLELVDVLTPHIGGIVEFYRWRGDELSIVASQHGYTSHVIGTRNLDMAIAGDFDGDGHVELLLPNQRRTELAAIRRVESSATVAWTLDVGGTLATNLAATSRPDENAAVGIGREDAKLRIWQ